MNRLPLRIENRRKKVYCRNTIIWSSAITTLTNFNGTSLINNNDNAYRKCNKQDIVFLDLSSSVSLINDFCIYFFSVTSLYALLQFILLFIQLFLPLAAAFFALFGNNTNNVTIMTNSARSDLDGFPLWMDEKTVGNETVAVFYDEDIFYLSSIAQVVRNLSLVWYSRIKDY